MVTRGSVLEALGDLLPLDLELLFYHISTPPTLSSALFSAPPGEAEEKTFRESHFLAVSLPARGAFQRELLVFAIEVLVFTTHSLTIIFISKADSTGYLHLLDTQPGTPSIIKTICTSFISQLVKKRLHGPRVLLSLLARSQNQYLFPGSAENPSKHVLDDRKLIKWWCRTLDPVLRDYESAAAISSTNRSSTTSSDAYIIVPGCDRLDARTFFPPKSKLEATSRWSNAYPRDLVVPDSSAPLRCLIPRFPDDPKARFLDDLDSEVSGNDRYWSGQWRSVKSLNQFWEMMSYRQECSAGRLVGFIWIIFTPFPRSKKQHMLLEDRFPECAEQPGQAIGHLPTPNQSQIKNLDPVSSPLSSDDGMLERLQAASPPPSSPLFRISAEHDQPPNDLQDETFQQNSQERQFRKSTPSKLNPDHLFYDPCETSPVRWPPESRGNLLLSEAKYQTLMTHLLDSDFSTQDLAAQSTSSWITRASELAETWPSWGQSVIGRKAVVPAAAEPNGAEAETTVNVLTGMIRKKRKVSVVGGDHGSNGAAAAAATTTLEEKGVIPEPELAASSVDSMRKKHKAG